MMKPGHPSYLELDRYVLGAAIDPRARQHLDSCSRCGRYVAEAKPAEDVPDWARALAPMPRRRPVRWLAVGTSVAVAAGFALWLRSEPAHEPSYIGTKGGASAGVYVSRGARVMLWDQSPLRAGDRIRLEVAPDGFSYVTVFGVDDQGAQTLLHRGPVTPFTRALLDKAWRLDDAGEREELVIVFSNAELSDQEASAVAEAAAPRGVQVLRLTLPKE